jgi:hypothetical protein
MPKKSPAFRPRRSNSPSRALSLVPPLATFDRDWEAVVSYAPPPRPKRPPSAPGATAAGRPRRPAPVPSHALAGV